jgi:hypothetical protein
MISARSPVCPSAARLNNPYVAPVPCPNSGASAQKRSDFRQNSRREYMPVALSYIWVC